MSDSFFRSLTNSLSRPDFDGEYPYRLVRREELEITPPPEDPPLLTEVEFLECVQAGGDPTALDRVVDPGPTALDEDPSVIDWHDLLDQYFNQSAEEKAGE